MQAPPEIDCRRPYKLVDRPGLAEQYHLFDEESALALRAALAARRPLLVRGEPGVGKTQLAAAAACALERPLVEKVVDSRTESRDLLWEFDAILRLADAQVAAAFLSERTAPGDLAPRPGGVGGELRETLAVRRYVRPGPLWWAFDWEDAARRAVETRTPFPLFGKTGDPKHGCVVLIDEIDKADSDVPNGLLEALGAGRFTPLGQSEAVQVRGEFPLVVITTNEERVLPNAFVRRCLVLELTLPGEEAGLVDHLVQRAAAHFPQRAAAAQPLFRKAAEVLVADRRSARDANVTPLPGQAEYLDLLRAVFHLAPEDVDRQEALLEAVSRFAVRKHERDRP
jgi:MoxR-like ATPase